MKVEPRNEFKHVSEQEALDALANDAANPIAAEILRLTTAYLDNFKAECDRIEQIPAGILTLKPRWPIEAVAKRLTTNLIREGLMRLGR